MDAHDDYAVDCLETCAWGISEAIQTLARCSHTPQRLTGKGKSQLCGLCLSIQTRLGLISTHLESDPDAASNPEVQRQAFDLLGILEIFRSKQSTISSTGPQEPIKERFASLCSLVEDGMRKDTLRRSVQAYLKNPAFVLEPLNKACKSLLDLLQTEDSENAVQTAEPEDHSRAHNSLFPVLRAYTICDSCGLHQHTKDTCTWHPTRLYLMDVTKSEDGLVRFDVITSSTADESWQDLCIEISATTGQRVTFASEVSRPSLASIQQPPERLHRFCQVFQHDDGCRISLKLQDGVLFRLGVEALKHRVSQGKGVSLADVLEHYTLSIREKFALSHVISSAFWQFYNSPLMHRAWNSHTIWFMPEPDLRDDSERLPLRVYISFHPEATECEPDALEFVQTLSLVHKCPRIQSLAILLLEIGLGKPFRCRSFDRQVLNLNYRYSVASEFLEELKSTKWDSFTHKYIFTDAVEECLKFDGLMGKDPSSDSSESHTGRREMLHRRVISRLEWLNRSFRVTDKRTCYLSAKRVASGLVLDSCCQANATSTTAKDLDQSSLNGQLVTNHHLTIDNHSSIQSRPSIKGSKYMHSTVPKQSRKRKRPTRQGDFEIAIICALTIEADAIEALFDEHWDDDWPCYGKTTGDSNAYTTGSIGPHNVILVHMPSIGKANAASVAANCQRSFPDIRLAIVVGVCGTVPFMPGSHEEIVLGDVIVSEGIIQYDFGWRHPDRFERKDTLLDSLGRPNTEIRCLLKKLRGIQAREKLLNNMSSYLHELRKETKLKAEYPGTHNDKLFGMGCPHASGSIVCQTKECIGQPVFRHRLAQGAPQPAIHFGLIASGDTVMKSGEERDAISERENVVGFEMEGAGVWDTFPCVIIKGACDYADSHKTKVFQRYAAATAASCAKAFLNHWVPSIRDRK